MAFERDYTALNVGTTTSLSLNTGTQSFLVSDLNKGKFILLGLSSNDTSDPIQRPFLKKITIGDTITIRVKSVNQTPAVQTRDIMI